MAVDALNSLTLGPPIQWNKDVSFNSLVITSCNSCQVTILTISAYVYVCPLHWQFSLIIYNVCGSGGSKQLCDIAIYTLASSWQKIFPF